MKDEILKKFRKMYKVNSMDYFEEYHNYHVEIAKLNLIFLLINKLVSRRYIVLHTPLCVIDVLCYSVKCFS